MISKSKIPKTLSITDSAIRRLRAKEVAYIHKHARKGQADIHNSSSSLNVIALCDDSLKGDFGARNSIGLQLSAQANHHKKHDALSKERELLMESELEELIKHGRVRGSVKRKAPKLSLTKKDIPKTLAVTDAAIEKFRSKWLTDLRKMSEKEVVTIYTTPLHTAYISSATDALAGDLSARNSVAQSLAAGKRGKNWEGFYDDLQRENDIIMRAELEAFLKSEPPKGKVLPPDPLPDPRDIYWDVPKVKISDLLEEAKKRKVSKKVSKKSSKS